MQQQGRALGRLKDQVVYYSSLLLPCPRNAHLSERQSSFPEMPLVRHSANRRPILQSVAFLTQLASETLILREQLLRTKADSRGADAALTNAQEDLAAALSRAQACEEAYEPLLAELESLKVEMKAMDATSSNGMLMVDHYRCTKLHQCPQCPCILVD